jgi:L-2,4-diaminobutyric acid acetyltransferase
LFESGHAGQSARYPARRHDACHPDHTFRIPTADDARGIADLIAACPPLDPNSLYCNLLQCTHFAGTAIVAERAGAVDGWISGYCLPDAPDTLFVWQVAVHERARGSGLAVAMLTQLLARAGLARTRWLKTTVTPSNEASRRMFARFARQRGAALRVEPCFDRSRHFGDRHESEELISIGPL